MIDNIQLYDGGVETATNVAQSTLLPRFRREGADRFTITQYLAVDAQLPVEIRRTDL